MQDSSSSSLPSSKKSRRGQPGEPAFAEPLHVPLCVDLDGTLLKTDTLYEQLAHGLQNRPWQTVASLLALFAGRARFKQALGSVGFPDPLRLPRNEEFLEWLQAERAADRKIYLVTAASRSVAEKIAAEFGIFTDVICSSATLNLDGKRKADALVSRFGMGGFDYAGNSRADLQVWPSGRRAIVVNAPPKVALKARVTGRVSQEFPGQDISPRVVFRAMRAHQWAKNVIIFVPILTSHRLFERSLWQNSILAFAALSCCASSVYLLNDIHDLPNDRNHNEKRHRPLPSAALPLQYGMGLVPVLLLLAVTIGGFLGPEYLLLLGFYFALTTGYSLYLKSKMLGDVVTLAILYATRLMAGSVATGIVLSVWLLVFSLFFFFSLAMTKRHSELFNIVSQDAPFPGGRAYAVGDLGIISALGCSSGVISVLVLALYVNSPEVALLYSKPEILLLLCPVLFYWIGRAWLLTHRGLLDEDPVLFAIKDRTSYFVFAAVLIVIWVAAVS